MTASSPERFRQSPGLPARTIGGEAVVITPHDSQVHELNPVGTHLFEACAEPRTLDELVAGLKSAFAVDEATARRDTQAFVERLVALGLLERL